MAERCGSEEQRPGEFEDALKVAVVHHAILTYRKGQEEQSSTELSHWGWNSD